MDLNLLLKDMGLVDSFSTHLALEPAGGENSCTHSCEGGCIESCRDGCQGGNKG